MKKIILIVVFLIVLLFVSAGLWAYFAFLYTKPLSKAELAQLTPDWSAVTHGNWSPWFTKDDGTTEWNPAASFNAWLATVPEEDKAWPGMIRIKEKYRHGALDNQYLGSRPNDAERWALLQTDLASPQSDEVLQAMKVALSKPVLGCVLSNVFGPAEHAAYIEFNDDFDPGPLEFDPLGNLALMKIAQPWLGDQRHFANFLESKAAFELEQGNVDEFVDTVVVLMGSTGLCLEYPTIIGQLVEVAIQMVCIELVDWAIENHSDQLTEMHLAKLENALAEQEDFVFLWQGEALMFHDTIRRLSNDNGALTARGVRTISGGGASFDIPVNLKDEELHASTQRTLLVYNRMLRGLADASLVPWDTEVAGAEQVFESQSESLSRLGKLFLGILAPATDRSSMRFRSYAQRVVGLRTGIAAHRYRLRHGEFPDSLSSIDKDLLPFRPIDAFTGEPLKYILTDSGPVIYSVGDDRIDNGGVQLWTSKMMEKLEQDGDNLSVVEVEIFSKVYPRWISQADAKAHYGVGSEDAQGDWILFPVPENDPEPLDNFDWDENGDLFIEED